MSPNTKPPAAPTAKKPVDVQKDFGRPPAPTAQGKEGPGLRGRDVGSALGGHSVRRVRTLYPLCRRREFFVTPPKADGHFFSIGVSAVRDAWGPS